MREHSVGLTGLFAGVALGLTGAGLTAVSWPTAFPVGSVAGVLTLAMSVVLAASVGQSAWLGLAPILGWVVGAWVVFGSILPGPGVRGMALTVAATAVAGVLSAEARNFSRETLAPMPRG